MNWMHRTLVGGCMLIVYSACSATEMIYTPISPTFGGNALNSSHIFNVANAQNDHKDPNQPVREKQTALQEFNDRLQRSILSRITSVLSANIIGSDGTINPGSFETSDFVISVEDIGGDQVRITTQDKLTGDETVFEIDSSI